MAPQSAYTEEDYKAPKKHVSFHANVCVVWHLHVNDYSHGETGRTWYTKEEVNEIKLGCAQTVRIMADGMCEDTEEFCKRGLEYRTTKGMRMRQKNKFAAWDVVYIEQNRQWEQGVCDDDSLAEVYSACTVQCSRAACLLATIDARFVQHQLLCLKSDSTHACTKLELYSLANMMRKTLPSPSAGAVLRLRQRSSRGAAA
jgi:hypothetical protein